MLKKCLERAVMTEKSILLIPYLYYIFKKIKTAFNQTQEHGF